MAEIDLDEEISIINSFEGEYIGPVKEIEPLTTKPQKQPTKTKVIHKEVLPDSYKRRISKLEKKVKKSDPVRAKPDSGCQTGVWLTCCSAISC